LPKRRRRASAVLLAAGALLAAPGLAAAQTPGAPGLGDPYYPLAGNVGYEVDHYDLVIRFAPKHRRIRAVTTISATASQDLSAFDLDLRGLKVSGVTVGGAPASFAHRGEELTVRPPSPIPSGSRFMVAVAYHGHPGKFTGADGNPSGWIATRDGAFTSNEPHGAPDWFPCNDHPSDKATFTSTVTVPKGLTVAGNGVLRSVTRHGGRRTFVWDETDPMVTYLATVTSGRFRVSQGSAGGIPSWVALDPREAGRARRSIRSIPAILGLFGRHFGAYPFSTTGAIVDDAPIRSFALETQTRPEFTGVFAPFTFILAHELSHQWFGDDVSIARWGDLWLNEGFATWSSWLWAYRGNDAALREQFNILYRLRPKKVRGLWNRVVDPGRKQLFGAAVYVRGAMTLEALRERVGDATFYRILQDWLAQHRYGNATTPEFTALAEADADQSLGHFFEVWLYRRGKPTNWS
jgi:aminopeptidase N